MSDRILQPKDPSDVDDYGFDWSRWLAGKGDDTIATSSWTVESGITKNSDDFSTTEATVTLSGGTSGTRYVCTNTITTAAGRTKQRSFSLLVQDR